jgi:hypothetical protein
LYHISTLLPGSDPVDASVKAAPPLPPFPLDPFDIIGVSSKHFANCPNHLWNVGQFFESITIKELLHFVEELVKRGLLN